MPVPISNVTRRAVYSPTGTGGAGPYAFTFEILANTDIAVYKDDVLLTLTTHYTVSIASNGTGSVTITATGLALSPTSPTQYAIVGNRTISRSTDFTTGGDFFANTLNDELDQQTIFAQQNAEGLTRSLQAPQTDPTTVDMTLPRASVRANKTLAFDSNGDPTTGEVIGDNRGNWSTSTSYNKRDIVKDTSNGNIYYANTSHTSTGSQPISTNADSAKWDLIVDNASAASSATAAAASASAASTSASNASTSASNASTSATNAAASASTASTQASNASTSATAAAASASSATSSATSATSSASTATTQASNASTSASNASTSASNAATSETNAAASASTATTQASNASTSATNASNSATSASTSASTATTQATNASNSATSATTSATNASNSATAASTSATNAANSETAAANSATAAAAAAASGMYSAVQDKSANYTVVAGDAGDLIRVTTTSGAVTITLPTISTVSDGFKIAIVKWTGDANAVTVARSSTNTINGATSATIGAQYSQTIFVADFETNQWFAASSGLGTSNVAVDAFSGDNSTVAFTLSADPGSENNTQVYVSGVYQEKDTYSVSGTTLTFSTAPPTGTSNIEVVSSSPLAIGTPSDGTVTTAKLASTTGSGAVVLATSPTLVTPTLGAASATSITVAAGAVGTPSITTAGDTNTGIFFPAADTIAFTEGGAEAMRIDSSGNVGIDNTSPNTRFVVGGVSSGASTNWSQFRANVGGNAPPAATPFGVYLGCNYSSGSSEGNIAYSGFLTFASWDGTTYAERARINANGVFCCGVTGGINDAGSAGAGNFKASSTALEAYRTSTGGNSISQFFSDEGSTTSKRAAILCNGGLQNYQANDSNLSDAREKTDFEPAKSYLNVICSIPVQTFKYINQSEEEKTLGVVAQDVQSVAPELITESNWGTTEEPKMRLSIYQTDLQYALMKSIQELKAINDTQAETINALTARIVALEK